jgi:hypothetical protein
MTHSAASRFRFPLLLVLLILPISALLASAYRNQPGAATISLVPDERHQTIHGWEAVAQASLAYLKDYDNKQDVLDELLDKAVDLGLTRVRLEVRSSAENTRDIVGEYLAGKVSRDEMRCGRYATVNDNDDPNTRRAEGFRFDSFDDEVRDTVLPLKRRLEARGEKLWINVNYVAFTDQICAGYTYHHDNPAEYAEFVLTVYEHLRDSFGLVPDSWEMILEPDNTRIWTGEYIARAALAAAERLKAAGFTPSIVGPSTTIASSALRYFEPSWEIAALRPYLTEMSYHRYAGATPEAIGAIGDMSRQRGVPTAMLEHIGSSIEALHQDLTVGNVSAWQQFALSDPGGDTGAHFFMIDPAKPAGERALLSSTGWYLRQYFRAFRPGGVRIGATSSDGAFAPVAVQHPDDRTAVVIKAERAGRVTIEGLAPGTYVTSCWTDRARWDRNPDLCDGTVEVGQDGAAVVVVPDAGAFSVVRQPHVAP